MTRADRSGRRSRCLLAGRLRGRRRARIRRGRRAPRGPPAAGSPGAAGSGNPGVAGAGTRARPAAARPAAPAPPGSGNPNFQLECSGPASGRPFLRLLTSSELLNTLNDIFPEVKGQWTATLPANRISSHGFDNDGFAQVGAQQAGDYVDTAKALATALVGTPLATILPCSTSATADRACAETFLNKYGRRLFRRPITTAEHDRYLAFYDASKAKSDFKTALKWMAVALIQSPNALYRSELGTDSGAGMRQLSPYEVATELAYTYTGTTPTDALLTMAASGNLGNPTDLAKSMLATDAGKQALHRFFEQYLGYAGVASMQKPNIASFASVAPDMVQETRAFINQVVFQNAGGLEDLLTGNTTNPSRALATYYGTGNMYTGGFPAPASDYASVTRPAALGIGVLAQGAFLATHAGSDASSPTKRGLFTYYKLFCAPHLEPPDERAERWTRRRRDGGHQHDARSLRKGARADQRRGRELRLLPQAVRSARVRVRKLRRGRAVPRQGEDVRHQRVGHGRRAGRRRSRFTDQKSMMTAIASQPIIHQCMSAYLAAFAYGSDEACLGASQVTALQSGSIGVAEAFARLANEPHFTQRSSQ